VIIIEGRKLELYPPGHKTLFGGGVSRYTPNLIFPYLTVPTDNIGRYSGSGFLNFSGFGRV